MFNTLKYLIEDIQETHGVRAQETPIAQVVLSLVFVLLPVIALVIVYLLLRY